MVGGMSVRNILCRVDALITQLLKPHLFHAWFSRIRWFVCSAESVDCISSPLH